MVSEGDQMITAYRIILLLTLTLVVSASPAVALAQVDQQALARAIAGDDRRAAQEAFDEATRALAPEEMGPELRAALIAALERQNEAYQASMETATTREALSPRPSTINRSRLVFWGEGYGFVIEAVAALRDPQAIPALVGALGTGWTATRAVAAFGEEAGSLVLSLAEGGDLRADQMTSAMSTLSLMIQEPQGPPLSLRTKERARRLVEQKLASGPDHPGFGPDTSALQDFVLQQAISLAIALDDPPLRELVTSLARDPDAVRRLGVEDSSAVERVQRHAAEALAKPPRRR